MLCISWNATPCEQYKITPFVNLQNDSLILLAVPSKRLTQSAPSQQFNKVCDTFVYDLTHVFLAQNERKQKKSHHLFLLFSSNNPIEVQHVSEVPPFLRVLSVAFLCFVDLVTNSFSIYLVFTEKFIDRRSKERPFTNVFYLPSKEKRFILHRRAVTQSQERKSALSNLFEWKKGGKCVRFFFPLCP